MPKSEPGIRHQRGFLRWQIIVVSLERSCKSYNLPSFLGEYGRGKDPPTLFPVGSARGTLTLGAMSKSRITALCGFASSKGNVIKVPFGAK